MHVCLYSSLKCLNNEALVALYQNIFCPFDFLNLFSEACVHNNEKKVHDLPILFLNKLFIQRTASVHINKAKFYGDRSAPEKFVHTAGCPYQQDMTVSTFWISSSLNINKPPTNLKWENAAQLIIFTSKPCRGQLATHTAISTALHAPSSQCYFC